MAIKLHNTLTSELNEFVSQKPGEVSLYTCGPTVYNYLHVGNWAAYIYWDILVRTLIANDYSVKRVMNITDVGHLVSDEDEGEDKLEKGAKREGKTAWEIADYYLDDFKSGMKSLGLIEPQFLPRATDYIDEQLELIRTLKSKGYTYQINDGIYFDTSKFPTYANFAHLDLAGQRAGARVEFNPEKRNPSDFALWKFSPSGEKRDMEWPTPTELLEDGKIETANSQIPSSNNQRMGFPGWHLECSAMSMAILGETLDIHTGGIDHIPVHHTDEIAQSESATGKRFSNYWLHNNHLKVNGTKISKSLENGYTLADLEQKGFSPMDYRMFILQGHYRAEGNFTFENLTAAKNRLHNWRNIAAIRHQIHDSTGDPNDKQISVYASSQAVLEALNDDLNTPVALKIIDEALSSVQNAKLSDIDQHALNSFLESIDNLLGLQIVQSTPDISDDTKRLILERNQARKNKDFKASDKLRDELEKQGITVRDTKHDTIWEYV